MRDDDTLTSMDLTLAAHGLTLALITALGRSGALPKDLLIEQLHHSALSLRQDGSHQAAEILESQTESLIREWAAESSDS